MGFDRNKGRGRRFKSGRRNEENFQRRKGSRDFQRNRNRGDQPERRQRRPFNDNDRKSRPLRGRRLIHKGSRKPVHNKKDELINDLDKQLTNYWVKSDTQKGKQKAKEEIKRDQEKMKSKMNSALDNYWKQAKQKKEQKEQAAQPAQQA